MTEKEAAEQTIVFWISSAQEALESARSELAAGRRRFAINRAYYACFYAASAVLLQQGRTFVKHSGVRAALHEHLVRNGRLERPWGEFYDILFRSRHQADYGVAVVFEKETAEEMIEKAGGFVHQMERLLAGPKGTRNHPPDRSGP